MTGYHAVLLQRYDVADGQTVTAKILRAADIEGLVQLIQSVLRIAPAVKVARIDGGVILLLDGKPFLLQILGVHIAEPRRVIIIPKLIDGKAVGRVIKERFLIVLRHEAVFDRLPFGSLHAEDSVKAANLVGIERHGLGVVRAKHIHGHVTLHKLQRTLLCQRQHIGIGVAVGVHALNRDGGVRDAGVVRCADRFWLLHRDLLHGFGSKALRLLIQTVLLHQRFIVPVDVCNQAGCRAVDDFQRCFQLRQLLAL